MRKAIPPLPVFFIFFWTLFLPAHGRASTDEVAHLRKQVEDLTKLVSSLTSRIEQLEMGADLDREMAKAPAAPARSPATPVPQSGTYQNMNPDISAVGIAVGKLSDDKRDPDRNSVSLQESEISLTKAVSPYARGNLTLGFHGEHAETEESYVDFSYLLPGKWDARVGKFLVPFGMLNGIHTHDWPMVARPLSNLNFLGDEGLSEEGVSFNTPVDLRSKTYMRTDLHFLKGNNGVLFNSGQTRAIGGTLLTKTPLTDRDDMNVTASFLQGAWNQRGDLDSKVIATSMLLRRRFNQFDRLSFWGEWLWNRREQVARSPVTAAGYSLSAMYKFKKDRTWHLGLEYDCSEKPGDSRFNAVARSAFLGYWLTENDRLQLQFRNVRDPFKGVTNNELLFEVIWGMGPHKPHLSNF